MKYLWCYPLFLCLFLLDRITKWIALSSGIVSYDFTSWLSCTVQLNRGISWGMLHSHNGGTFVCVTLMVIAITCGVVLYAVHQWYHSKPIYGQTMILAGSVSNIFDRVVYGGVVDFIHVHIGNWSFAIFNIADVVIVLGVCIMIVQEVCDTHE